jgi:hypothetical protein
LAFSWKYVFFSSSVIFSKSRKIKVKKDNPKKTGGKGAIGGKKKKEKDPNAVFDDSDATTDSDEKHVIIIFHDN